ncbi:Ribonuclease H superfamily [Sesbania bispinosa]|nr:Ribonuclease H superfamily [Sesbania bispinosa]
MNPNSEGISTLDSMIDRDNHCWKVNTLKEALPADLAIRAYQTPISWFQDHDKLFRPYSRDGKYSVRTGYHWPYIGKPPPGVIKCNSNATWISTSRPASISFVARDSQGALLLGHAKKIPASSPLVAEASALREALMTSYNLNWRNVIMESVCLQLVQACRREKLIAEIQVIVNDIHTLSASFILCGFTWVQRNGNQVAHEVARSHSIGGLQPCWVSNHPPWLKNLLPLDKAWNSRLMTSLEPPHNKQSDPSNFEDPRSQASSHLRSCL